MKTYDYADFLDVYTRALELVRQHDLLERTVIDFKPSNSGAIFDVSVWKKRPYIEDIMRLSSAFSSIYHEGLGDGVVPEVFRGQRDLVRAELSYAVRGSYIFPRGFLQPKFEELVNYDN